MTSSRRTPSGAPEGRPNLPGAHVVDTTTDPLHCGGCAGKCPVPPNAVATCSSSTCGYACTGGFLDCDNGAANGCEIDPGGGCGDACSPLNVSTQLCAGGLCAPTRSPTFGDCNGPAAGRVDDGCESKSNMRGEGNRNRRGKGARSEGAGRRAGRAG